MAGSDDHRTIAEFCENGAKAVADEATSKKITANFFEKYSVVELSLKSDEWLNSQPIDFSHTIR